eukprot:2987506-Prymnesium_polylepis.1
MSSGLSSSSSSGETLPGSAHSMSSRRESSGSASAAWRHSCARGCSPISSGDAAAAREATSVASRRARSAAS